MLDLSRNHIDTSETQYLRDVLPNIPQRLKLWNKTAQSIVQKCVLLSLDIFAHYTVCADERWAFTNFYIYDSKRPRLIKERIIF